MEPASALFAVDLGFTRAHYLGDGGERVNDFWRLDATAQAQLAREKAVRPIELVDAAIARIEYDVWLSSTLAEPPPLGSFDAAPDNPMHGLLRAVQFIPFTPIFNATGQPAMSVPLAWNGEQLPIGVQFAARYGDEAMLFRLAAQLEQARPWAARWPAV